MTPSAPGSLVARAHPFTSLTVTLAVVVLAFLLPASIGPVVLALLAIAVAAVVGDPASLTPSLIIVVPLWLLLLLVQGVLGDAPFTTWGPLTLSIGGLDEALAQGARLTAIVVASMLALRGFRASRFVDAAAERRWPFSAAYLVAATLQTIPRLRQRVTLIRDAQRSRGLRVQGSIVQRVTALVPLTLPLILGALADTDDRAVALEGRAIAAVTAPGARRTPLAPPVDTVVDRVVRWGSVLAVAVAIIWRITR
ncbi:MAG TPA: energy-coupling factor transporter transmembrane component T [Gemmatimonadales bacterium]|nr:energy-coupling factor transporter transmembrane component T [Gemmatimonadales bacterium]